MAKIKPVRRALAMVLLVLLAVQLGPACGFGNAAAMDSMQCCQSKCPATFFADVGELLSGFRNLRQSKACNGYRDCSQRSPT